MCSKNCKEMSCYTKCLDICKELNTKLKCFCGEKEWNVEIVNLNNYRLKCGNCETTIPMMVAFDFNKNYGYETTSNGHLQF